MVNLTPKQQTIVALDLYPQYLRAGAGTGKTEVLIQKILHILKTDHGTSLKNFGVITFTNKATDEMRTRLSDSLYSEWLACLSDEKERADFVRSQTEITSMIDICTIHGFCERLLRQYGLAVGIPLNFKIKSFRHETTEILNGIVSKHYENPLLNGIPQYRISKLIDILLTNNSNHGIALVANVINGACFETPDNDFWNSFKGLYLNLYFTAYETIESHKHEQSILTPNDLIRKTVELLRNDYIASKVAEQYHYLFIDEFQDTNKDQFDFVSVLISKGVKVFLVGDDKQSVYAFRGADVENSRAMSSLITALKEVQDDKEYYLDENFRTDGKLIDVINHIFEHNFTFGGQAINFPIEPLAIPESSAGTGIDDCLDIMFEAPIVDVIEKALSQEIGGKKPKYGDIAILCRRNFDLDRIAEILKQAGYPVEVVGGKGFYRAKEIIDTYKLFIAVINKDIKYRNELVFTDYYTAIKSNALGMDFGSFLSDLEVIFRRETVEEILTYIFDKSCIFEFYRTQQNYQAVSNLHKLKDISRNLMNKENMQPLQFLEYLYIMLSTGQEEDDADIAESERKNGVIRLYSIHKAKGLAFPIVIVPCLDNKLNRPITKPKIILDIKSEIPMLAIDNEAVGKDLPIDADYAALLKEKVIEHLAEEIRIFYVACTRAKHKLILCCNRPYGYVAKSLQWDNYASVAKWLCEIDNGKFLGQYRKIFN